MLQPDCFLIGSATLVYPPQHRVQRDGRSIRIEPRLMTLLLRLTDQPGTVVSRADLLDAAWPEGYGTDEGLTKAISGLRRALGDTARAARIIETVPKRGYRLVAPIVHPAPEAPAPEPASERPSQPASRSLRRRIAPLWVAVAVLAIALVGQWLYLARDADAPIQRQIRYHIPLGGAAEALPLASDTTFLGTTEGAPVVVRHRVHLPAP